MFLKCNKRYKDGKNHRYWNIVETKRVAGGRAVQRQVLYLGEINDSQKKAWRKTIEVFEEDDKSPKQMLIFPEDKPLEEEECNAIRVKLNELSVNNARQWGSCWLFCELWNLLSLDRFWQDRLPPSRKGTRWLNVLKTLTAYRLIDPGSEWRLHRMWYDQNAIGELLGEDFAIAQKDKLYRCLDKLLEHKRELFSFLRNRWENLFDAKFDILLYDLTSTYFECDVPESGKRKFGYSRDKRSDCVQVVIALVITPDGFPLAYEVMPGNTKDSNTLEEFLEKIEKQYGKSNCTWMMDRGIPTEETIKKMKKSDSEIKYLIGTPKGKLTKLEKEFLDKPWEQARQDVRVKLLEQDEELYVLVESASRINKERSIRRRKLKKLWSRLKQLQSQNNSRDQLLIKIGAAKKEAGRAYSLVKINLPEVNDKSGDHGFNFSLRKEKLREVIKKEGKYLLRSNMTTTEPALLWKQYMLLTEIEQAFKEIKGDLSIRPIHHQKDQRIEAHIFVAFQAYCLNVTLKAMLQRLAPGLTPREVIDKFKKIQMVDIHVPTTDGRNLLMSRYTQPEKEHMVLLDQLKLKLPEQSPPKITANFNKIMW
jgi:transposase